MEFTGTVTVLTTQFTGTAIKLLPVQSTVGKGFDTGFDNGYN